MKSIKNIYLTAVLTACGLLYSCSGFEELNMNPNQPTSAESYQLFTRAQFKFSDNIWDEWNNGRMGMYYAQYWSSTYYTDESRYKIREGTNQTMWNTFYADVLRELEEAKKIEEANPVAGYENRIAIIEVQKALVYHYITDIYGGPIPYSEAINDEIATPKYESGEEVYSQLLASLETQIATLNEADPGFLQGDVVYGGNVRKWKKFANSLRIRIALRMIDAKPEDAKQAISKSLQMGTDALISSNDESAMFRFLSSAPNNNPLNQAFKTRVDFSVSEALVDYLEKYEDPRLPVYAEPLKGDPTAFVGEIYGLEQGDERQSNGAVEKVSLPSNVYSIGAEAPAIWLDYAEVEFMLAEIEARDLGIDTGASAEEHYKKGIMASFAFTGLSDEAAAKYLEKVPYNPEKWKDCIGSQKWLAMYMQGIQSWFERLRLDFKDPYTGEEIFYPLAAGSTDADVEMVPFRMSYPVTEASLNESNYMQAIELIGGKNSKGVKQWWDKF